MFLRIFFFDSPTTPSNKLYCIKHFQFVFFFRHSQDIHVTPEPEFIRDGDEMEMSDDESDHHMRYGKRARVDSRVCSTF